MQWFETIVDGLKSFSFYSTFMDWRDVLEILIIAFLMYCILVWMKTTRAWLLLRGLIVICVFLALAALMEMNTIMWIVQNVLGFAVVAVIIVMQPELRHALEELGKKNYLPSISFSDSSRREQEVFSEKTISEITRACAEMGKVKTGALIVIEQGESLKEYERTGIDVDGLVTSQLLINIFEHNTPLHDGAVIIRGNRIVSATCYLPLSDNMALSKDLGTRHRAAVGMSEVSDALIIAVSEETGAVSVAQGGLLNRGVTREELREKLLQIQNRKPEARRFSPLWKGRQKNEEKADE